MSKIKNRGLDQYGAESFEQQQFGTAGAEWVKGLNRNFISGCVCAQGRLFLILGVVNVSCWFSVYAQTNYVYRLVIDLSHLLPL